MFISKKPKQITDLDGYNLVVNRADQGDENVVISFYSSGQPQGFRDAIGMSPQEAIEMATALIQAAWVVDDYAQ